MIELGRFVGKLLGTLIKTEFQSNHSAERTGL